MNGLEIAVIIIVGVCLWIGYRQGLFRTLVVTVAMAAAIGLSSYACPYVSNALQKYTTVDERIEADIEVRIEAYVTEHMEINVMNPELTKTEQMYAIDALPLPERIKTAIISNNDNDENGIYGNLQVHSFGEYLSKYLTRLMINVLSFLIVQVLIMVGLFALLYATKILAEIPILHGIDKAGGIGLGAVAALLIIWLGFLFISLLGSTPMGVQAFSQINESKMLTFLFSHNIILDVITNVSRMIFT